ncbi:6364_t:CDS:2 [Ambispora leptoticha]|uniref:6364_t:CDS:1 n=1 Tax=Ambispora leptoticha TaxID=144679 RepID=A0A9N9DTZ5_9GLOM|nr:6364_t:CDS:2 [Ambispora leptoticha]
MVVYNTNTKSQESDIHIKVENAKLPFRGFTATYIQDYNITIYIGGNSSDGNLIPMNQIWTLDISTNSLSLKTTPNTSNIVGRYGHSACLVQNKIIVYGGKSEQPLDSNNALIILEINENNYNWLLMKLSQDDQSIITPYYHTATIINDTYMIVAFGKDDNSTDTMMRSNANTKRQTSASNTNSISIIKIDVDGYTYKRVESFDEEEKPESTVNPTTSTPNSSTNAHSSNKSSKKRTDKIVGGVIGGILGVALLSGLVFFFYRRNKERKSNSLNELTRQSLTQQSLIPPAPSSRSIPQMNNLSIQPLQTEKSAPVLLIPPLTNLNISKLSSVESRQPLDSSSSGPSLLSIPLISTSPFYRHDE